jgi:SAM-dependent methyltransferase
VSDSRNRRSAEEWAEALAAWAIPDEILARAPESPWQLPRDLFARRTDLQIERREGSSIARAEEALAVGGSVLDVGAGAGAGSLPLRGMSELVAVDLQPDMLEELLTRAKMRGLKTTGVVGRWPEVAPKTPAVDVAVCHHVLYNVPEIVPFVEALDQHARRRVVIELTTAHPLAGLNPLWRYFHQLQRPERPTWRDAVAALRASGLDPRVEHSRRGAARSTMATFEDVVRMTRLRLCLDDSREAEVVAELGKIGVRPEDSTTWSLGSPDVVTLWWDSGR